MKSIGTKLRAISSTITIEPALFFQMAGLGLTQVISQNLYIERVCRVSLGYSDEICGNVTRNEGLEEDGDEILTSVHAKASRFNLYRGLIEAVLPVVPALFLGSWSDKNGNKFPLLLALFGYVLSAGLCVLFTFLPDVGPELLLLAQLPQGLGGAMLAVTLAVYGYLCSVTTAEARSFRFAIMDMCWFFGMPVGYILGAKIYKDLGFAAVYEVAFALFAASFFLVLIFMKDRKPSRTWCRDLVNVPGVWKIFVTLFKRRPLASTRIWLILLILVCSGMQTMARFGPLNCLFLFARFMFGWNEQQYSNFMTAEWFITVAGGVAVSVIGLKLLKLPDSVLAIQSILSLLACNLAYVLAPRDGSYGWVMYLAISLQFSGSLSVVFNRSIISKMVPPQDVPNLFTLLAILENSLPIVAGIFYSMIYTKTEATFAGAFGLLSAGMNLCILLTFVIFHFAYKRNPSQFRYEEEPAEVKS